MKNHRKYPAIAFSLLILFSPAAMALDSGYSGNYLVVEAQSGFYQEQYEVSTMRKLQRGLENFFLSPLEIPYGIKTQQVIRRSEYLPVGIESIFLGFFRGVGGALRRAGVGFYEGVTFLYPQDPILEEMDEWLY